MLFELGGMEQSVHEYMKPKDNRRRTVLMDATDVVLQSENIPLAQKGYNSDMDFQLQFVLLYLHDALTLEPLYYRLREYQGCLHPVQYHQDKWYGALCVHCR